MSCFLVLGMFCLSCYQSLSTRLRRVEYTWKARQVDANILLILTNLCFWTSDENLVIQMVQAWIMMLEAVCISIIKEPRVD
jgi:hypothetical protein